MRSAVMANSIAVRLLKHSLDSSCQISPESEILNLKPKTLALFSRFTFSFPPETAPVLSEFPHARQKFPIPRKHH